MAQAKRRRSLAALLLVLFACAGLTACGPADSPPLRVVATIAPLADWAQHVGQDRVVVTQIVPAGQDPRTYALSEADRLAISTADIVLSNGLNLEPWLTPALIEDARPSMIAIDLAQFIADGRAATQTLVRQPLSADPNDALSPQRELVFTPPQNYSPYLWLDPGPDKAQRAVTIIADTFTRADPDHVLRYRRNAERYNGDLENLDNWIERQVLSWPRLRAGQQKIVSINMPDRSWHYFAQRYRINLRTIEQLSNGRSSRVAAPLFIDQFNTEQQRGSALGIRQPDGVLRPLGADSYIQLMRNNVETMTRGIQRAASLTGQASILDATQ